MTSFKLVLLFLFSTHFCLTAGDSWLEISPQNRSIHYSGRLDFNNKEKPRFCYPGVAISIVYEGSTAEVFMNELGFGSENTTNYFQVILDDSISRVWKLNPGKNKFQVSTQKGKHTLTIFKRTECSVGACEFMGINLLQPATLFPSPKPPLLMEFIGDSYTCGYGNELSIPAPPAGNPNTGFRSANENNYMAWGAIAARTLKADYQTVAYSGRGIYRNNTGSTEGTIPELYFELPSSDFEESEQPIVHPDYIIIHLGTNDFFPESNGDLVDSTSFTKSYSKFLRKLKAHHPKARIICVMSNGLSDWWPEKVKSRTRCMGMMQAVVKAAKDPSIYFLDLGIQSAPYGEDWHPSIPTHKLMAEKLVTFIQSLK